MAGVLNDVSDNVELKVGRDGNIDDFHRRIGEQFEIVRIDVRYPMSRGNRLGLLAPPRSNCDRIESRVPIGHEVAVRHDKPRADTANPHRFVSRQTGKVVEFCGSAGSHFSFLDETGRINGDWVREVFGNCRALIAAA